MCNAVLHALQFTSLGGGSWNFGVVKGIGKRYIGDIYSNSSFSRRFFWPLQKCSNGVLVPFGEGFLREKLSKCSAATTVKWLVHLL